WDSSQILEEMFAAHIRYKPDLFITERGVIEKTLGPLVRAEMLKRNTFINLYPEAPTKDKLSRARALQARMKSGGIRFKKDASWYFDLEDEMIHFPKTKHDDQVDALSWIGLVLDRVQSAPSAEEEAEDEYDEMVRDERRGQSQICGY
ncbi:MAG: phage terminase large subunit, partial [Thaumarchaeota archaeon]|nr:phage terminase large subunit [Nitrososphaerota archaeon]